MSVCLLHCQSTASLLGLIHCRCLCAAGIDAEYERRAIVTALVSVFGVAMVVIVVFTAVRVYLMRRRQCDGESDDAITESTAAFLAGYGPLDSTICTGRSATGSEGLKGLKIDQLISHGRYGDVYRGILGADEVAIKVIQLCNSVLFAFCL